MTIGLKGNVSGTSGTIQIGGADQVTVDNTGGISASNTFGFKNRIINGAMMIDQRNAGASVTPTNGQYTIDRWVAGATAASKITLQQNAGSVTPPVGFTNYLGITSSSAYTVAAGDVFNVAQIIEGLNIADLAWGTANAKSVTLSFQVYSSLTGTFGGSIANNGGSRSYPFSYSIPVANTWTTISITIPGDTTGTWLTTNGIGLYVRFGLGAGSTFTSSSGSWQAGNYVQPTGTVSVVGTSGATFYITGVQLEKGSTATAFDVRPYGTELALCQRYYETASTRVVSTGSAGVNAASTIYFSAIKRAAPTMGFVGTPAYGNASTLIFNTAYTSCCINDITLSGANVCGWALFQYSATAEL